MSKKLVLVTGGTGYIGSHCIVELLKEGYDVVTIDNGSNSRSAVLRRVQTLTGQQVTYVEGDLCNKDTMQKLFKKYPIEFVIHFGAAKNVGESVKFPFLYYENNLRSTLNLLEAMRDHNVYQIVFSSSCGVYGDPEKVPLSEADPTGVTVTSPYGRTKYFIEQMLRDLAKADQKWNIIALRYFNPIGAHPSGDIGEDNTKKYSNLMPLISQVAAGKKDKLTVFGGDYETHDGTAIRDYIHIMDLVEGHVIALNKLQKVHAGFKPYNLGLGKGLTVLDLVREFEKVSGHKVAYEITERREGDVTQLVCDASLAAQELNWLPKRGVKEMCEDFWRWQQKNPDGYVNDKPFASE